MWKRRGGLGRLTVAATMVLIAACAAGDPSSAGPGPTKSVEALIGDAACDSDAQCHTIGVGAKACGGPQRYLAWSSQRTDGPALQGAAERERRLARAKVESSGVMSNCAVTTDPGAYCSAPGTAMPRQCRLRASGSGGSARSY